MTAGSRPRHRCDGGGGSAGTGADSSGSFLQRDPVTQELVADKVRFPQGMRSLGDYIHAAGGRFGLYSAESATTCGDYPASLGYETLDARTFGSWGVDYMKARCTASSGERAVAAYGRHTHCCAA